MDCLYEKELMILPSHTDPDAVLSRLGIFMLFMDIASEHAQRLGIGAQLYDRGLFWLTVKTMVRISARPRLGETVTLQTWPEPPGKARTVRSYRILKDGRELVTGKTEWAILTFETGRPAPVAGIFPPELVTDRPSACPEPFFAIEVPEREPDLVSLHPVRTTDVDLGKHMNNGAYVRAILDTFSVGELLAADVERMEVVFRAPCLEGDVLEIRRYADRAGVTFDVRTERGTAVLARADFRKQ